jgi:redox-sensitive bicupin YhaK (pirin superfamily)
MTTPRYRDIQSEDIPELILDDGVVARVIAGSSHGLAGAVQREVTDPLYIDIHFEGPGSFQQTLPASSNAFVYVYRGEVQIGDQAVASQSMAILGNEAGADGVVVGARGPARALLIAGRPLNEPIAQHGPFVMNTTQELYQAVADFQAGKFHQIG